MFLFAGNERAYGPHGEPDPPINFKYPIKGTAKTIQGRVTATHWQAHIAGQTPLGINPTREDGTCSWGSIDFNGYWDSGRVFRRLSIGKYPLVPCCSKSGGLHLFLFLKSPAPSVEVQIALRDAAKSLKLGQLADYQIFPKLSAESDADDWILMPYFGDTFGGKLSYQRGQKITGADMTIREFLTACEKARISVDELSRLRRMPNGVRHGD